MRRLLSLAILALAAACEAPISDDAESAAEAPLAEREAAPGEPEREPPSYAGEWASSADSCGNIREIWTIEEYRMGMKRQRFCVFERVFTSTSDTGQGWSASARCLADGRESNDFVFFRVNPSRQQMRVTINDAESVELVRCPMRT